MRLQTFQMSIKSCHHSERRVCKCNNPCAEGDAQCRNLRAQWSVDRYDFVGAMQNLGVRSYPENFLKFQVHRGISCARFRLFHEEIEVW